MRFRLLALDVDGTLLDSRGDIRPRVREAVRDAIAGGCRVVLATGRRLQSAVAIAQTIGVSTLILTDGTVIYDLKAERAVYERVLSPDSQRDAVDLILGAGIQPILLESPAAGGLILTGPESLDSLETGSYLGPKTQVRRLPLDDLVRSVRIVSALALGEQWRVEALVRQATEMDRFTLVYWQPSTAGYSHHTLTFSPPETSKGRALTWFAEEAGISLAETMAVGDYENDVSLVQTAGWGVAMGNAVASVKNVARAIVADNDHDGVAEAIERWVLADNRLREPFH